ncbi:MAG: hypothetical protein AAB575_02110 [Patescibacteria group bacterium]
MAILCCYVCDQTINGQYYKDDHGQLCFNCHEPKVKCFTCGKQLAVGKEMRLADYRVTCPVCYAEAVFAIEQEFVSGLEKILKRSGWYPSGKIIFEIVDLPRLMIENGNSSRTMLGTCNTNVCFNLNVRVSIEHRVRALFGLPRTLFICTLTHELFHAWLNENIDRNVFSAEETEWLCEHGSYLFALEMKFDEFWIRKVVSSRDSFQVDSSFKNKYDVLSAREFVGRLRSA